MADQTYQSDVVTIQCICGAVLEIEPQRLGMTTQCQECKRYLRPALQFLLVDRADAHNLTAQCACGHFIVDAPDRTGKRSRCKVCRSHLIMPQPVVKFTTDTIVRVPRKALQRRMKRAQVGRQRAPVEMPRLKSAAHTGRVTLRPGEHICINDDCGALLGVRANVCPRCATNRLTGAAYIGPGPDRDPLGHWQEP
jgi:hypothetical protein